MPGPFTAQSELSRLRERRGELERVLIAALEVRDAATVQQQEEEIATVDGRIEELVAVLEHSGSRDALQGTPALFRIIYCCDRRPGVEEPPLDQPCILTDPAQGDAGVTIPLGLDALAVEIGRWSVANLTNKITSSLVASHASFMGLIEGPKQQVRSLFADKICHDSRVDNVVVLCEQSVRGRVTVHGASLSVVEDPLLALTIERMRTSMLRGHRFAPSAAIALARRGAHPLSTTPTPLQQHVVMAVMLDGRCGAVHRADRYRAAASAIVAAVTENGGSIIDRFGESMTAWFPYAGGATAAMTAAMTIHTSVPLSVQAIAEGKLTVVEQPSVVVCGPALLEAVKLLHLAESIRRPLVLSEAVGSRVNRARQPVDQFTSDLVPYFTHASIWDKRLENPPEPDLIKPYNPPPEPEVPPAMVRDDCPREQGVKQPYVRGSRTQEDLETLFRKLDKANVGWVSKAAFLDSVARDPDFPKCIDDLAEKALTGWLERCNKLGESRLNFNEFAILCLKMDAS